MGLKEIIVNDSKKYWNYYNLDDGTTLKVKIVLIKVFDNGNDPNGNPYFGLQSSNVIGVTSSNDLIGKDPIDIISNMGYKTQNDDVWNEYILDNGFTLMLKPTMLEVNRTDTRDPCGIPVYEIKAQEILQIIKSFG